MMKQKDFAKLKDALSDLTEALQNKYSPACAAEACCMFLVIHTCMENDTIPEALDDLRDLYPRLEENVRRQFGWFMNLRLERMKPARKRGKPSEPRG